MESRGPDGGKIITFYSYKGGTGRSMALANVAWILASQGKRVLVLDWDLEAPGLHRYFHPFLADKDLTASDGIIDFVIKFATAATTPRLLPRSAEQAGAKRDPDSGRVGDGAPTEAAPAEREQISPDWYKPYANILRYARSLDWTFEGGGTLDFIPAGRQGPSYSTRVNSFNWATFYERLGGGTLLEEAKRKMRDEYDYILIDSRTGVSDTAGVCTVQMPDMLVICFTLNNQSIEGASAVAVAVHEQRLKAERDIQIFPVPTRVENAEQDKRTARSSYAKEKFSPFPLHKKINRDEYWNNVPVLYIPYYAYEEILAAFGAKDETVNSLLAATERLTSYLVGSETRLRPPDPELRKEKLALYEGRRVETSPAREQAKAAEYLFNTLSQEEQTEARRIFLRLVRVASSGDVDGNTRRLVSLRDFGENVRDKVLADKGRAFENAEVLNVRELIEALCNARLLEIVPETPSGGGEALQIAQDALVQGWKRLQDWIKEDRKFLLWRQEELQPAVGRWEQHHRDDELLLRGSALREARTWLLSRKADLFEAEQLYIQTSLAREQREEERARGGHPISAEGGLSPENEREILDQTMSILRGRTVSSDEMWRLAVRLKESGNFSLARKLLERAQREPDLLKEDPARALAVAQQLAICTCKDPDLPIIQRQERALEILNRQVDLGHTKDQETLGIVGSIYKRRWQVDGFKHHLERSLAYYLRGYQEGVAKDFGYTGINAAFVLDLLADQETEVARQAGSTSASAEGRRADARRIREDVVATLSRVLEEPGNEYLHQQWWFLVTLAEAHFGLRQYQEALSWMRRAAALQVPDWQRETTAQQLVTLARIQDEDTLSSSRLEGSEAWQVLRAFLGDDVVAVRMAFLGKVGLALSGGGFRAGFFHIGVLARLAELDVLRYVEVLSCVSGGSIVGTHYYLELRKLLQTKRDSEITREDYIAIIRRLERDFLRGVERNIRIRAAAEWFTNLKAIFSPTHTRTARMGELCEREIFSRVEDGEGDRPRLLNELGVRPMGERENFQPKYNNWRRVAKVPDLILNATTLNTGHNWQFTTSWMGESANSIERQIDSNDRLWRTYYSEAPEAHRRVRLGHAVAASCSVPGLFEPLALKNLYPERVVRLVDGSFKDGQGVGALLENDCTIVLASDASGQMTTLLKPRGGFQQTLIRTFAILIHSLRESNYHELAARRTSSLLRGMMYVHLKKDLDSNEISAVGSESLNTEAGPALQQARAPLTCYGISKEIQEKLANIRTDFDSFSEAEAYALMTSGYHVAGFEFASSIRFFPPPPRGVEQTPWRFLAVEPLLKGEDPAPGARARFMEILEAARASFFKAATLSKPYGFAMGLLGYLLFSFLFLLLFMLADEYVLGKVNWWAILRNPVTLILLYPALLIFAARPLDFIVSFWMLTFGTFFARVRLHFSDRFYMRMGRLARILGTHTTTTPLPVGSTAIEEGKAHE